MNLCKDIHGSQRLRPNDLGDLDEVDFLKNILATFGWIAMKFGLDIHILLRMY